MRYLGIDPGTTRVGYGVVDAIDNDFRCLAYGILCDDSDTAGKQTVVAAALRRIISIHRPDRAAVEKLFFFKNKKSVMAVSEMRGVIMLVLAEHLIPTTEFTPLQVKRQICGHGRAEKHQIQKMARLLLKLNVQITPDDAADALAIALCGAVATREY